MKDLNNFSTLSSIGEHRIEDFFGAFSLYVTKRYGADLNDIICDWNMVEATFRYFGDGDGINIQLKVWEHSNGEFNLPDNVVIIYGFETGPKIDETEFRPLLLFIMEQGSRHGFRYLVSLIAQRFANEKSVPVRFERNAVPGTAIPCLKFA